MGMYDQSWCNGCGTGLPYSDEDETYCGACANNYAQQHPTKLLEMIAYTELHLISLEQDQEVLSEQMEKYDEDSKAHRSMDEEYLYLSGQITAASHLLSVARDILKETKGD